MYALNTVFNKGECMKDIFNEYKEKICPHCIHYLETNYQDCNIVKSIDGEANCINFRCKDYRRRKDETNIISQ